MILSQSKSGVAGNGKYASNYDRIFGTAEERKAKASKEQAQMAKEVKKNKSASVQVFETFISPIDGQPVSNRAELKAHNKRHGVTNMSDYGEGYFAKRRAEKHQEMLGNTPQAKEERRQLIEQQLYKHGVLKP